MEHKARVFNGVRKIRLGFTVLTVAVVFCVSGCCTINDKPFNEFSTAVTNTQNGIESNTNLAYDFSKTDFKNRFIDSKKELNLLIIGVTDNPPNMVDYKKFLDKNSENPPGFIQIQKTRNALLLLDYSFSTYASLLLTLAKSKSFTKEELAELSSKANAAASVSWKMSGETPPEGTGVFIGKAFADIADVWLKCRIKSSLEAAISNNQRTVKEYAGLGKKLVGKLRNSIGESYLGQFNVLDKKWVSADDEKRRQLLSEMLSLNAKYIGALELLAKLDVAYDLIPKANCDLAKSLEDSDAPLIELRNFAALSQELEILNNNLAAEMLRK